MEYIGFKIAASSGIVLFCCLVAANIEDRFMPSGNYPDWVKVVILCFSVLSVCGLVAGTIAGVWEF